MKLRIKFYSDGVLAYVDIPSSNGSYEYKLAYAAFMTAAFNDNPLGIKEVSIGCTTPKEVFE